MKVFTSHKSDEKFRKIISDIKTQFNDIKEESFSQENDDWLEIRRKEDSGEYERQLRINKKIALLKLLNKT